MPLKDRLIKGNSRFSRVLSCVAVFVRFFCVPRRREYPSTPQTPIRVRVRVSYFFFFSFRELSISVLRKRREFVLLLKKSVFLSRFLAGLFPESPQVAAQL